MSGIRSILRTFVERPGVAGVVDMARDMMFAPGIATVNRTCSADLRSVIRTRRGATNVADVLEYCKKQSSEAYAWTPFDAEFNDEQFAIYDDGDSTKRVQFEASGITTATTRTLTVPDASGTIALTSDLFHGLHIQFITFQTAGLTWTNMPAAATEILASTGYRQYIDTTGMDQVKLGVGMALGGHTTAIVYLEYSTNNGSSWNAAVTSNADQVSIAAAGFTNGTWQNLVSGGKGNHLWRIVGSGGNATADPNFVMIAAQFR